MPVFSGLTRLVRAGYSLHDSGASRERARIKRRAWFSLAGGPGQGPDAAVELAPAPTLERRPQDIPPAALGAPPGEETFPGSDIYPMPVHDVDSEEDRGQSQKETLTYLAPVSEGNLPAVP